MVRPLRNVCVCVCAHVALYAMRGRKSNCGAYILGRLGALRSGHVRIPHLPSQDAAERVCVCVCCVYVHGYHLGRTSGARLDCTVSQSTFNLPGALSPRRKVKASARTAPSPRNTNSGGRCWLSIIDGSWL